MIQYNGLKNYSFYDLISQNAAGKNGILFCLQKKTEVEGAKTLEYEFNTV